MAKTTKLDPAVVDHLEWIGFVQPTGLVVSAPALVRAGAILDRRDSDGQQRLVRCTEPRRLPKDKDSKESPFVADFRRLATGFLGWSFSPKFFAGTTDSPIRSELELPLAEHGETLRPDFAVREPEPATGKSNWQLLVRVLDPDLDFDEVTHGNGALEASAHGRMERLLRHTRVTAGLLFNGRALRLISAPYGESSGWADFRVPDMATPAGRPIATALRLLLNQSRLLSLPRAQRLTALLEDSRKFQNEVSERLAEQVLHALYELLRGLQLAHDATRGELLREALGERPDEVYRALLTVVLRLVFLLYAEERGLLSQDDVFGRHYSLAGLYARLRDDAALHPDTMEQRFGAWAQLLALFRLVHDGARAGDLKLPARHGVLFDPDRYPFLEGRPAGGSRQQFDRIVPPLIPDGTIWRALEKLLVLDGERLSYRALDVEQIGSVYETMMGFRLETASGRSLAIRAQSRHGAPTTVDLEALLAQPPDMRDTWLNERAARKLADSIKRTVKVATSVEDLHAALHPVADEFATPDLARQGAMILQPSEERRRSGSHYTPRTLTQPIVQTTLDPILKKLLGSDGRSPRPEQILDLRVCDPAMGSGAFLVEACRQLAEALIESWNAHGGRPAIPPDEDQTVLARRLIAQRCLYGVDRNPVAVDLAKVSLWLVTLARDHALTFVDHALRHGDSLVGLSRRQLEAFHWDPSKSVLKGFGIREPLDRVRQLRRRIREADESVTDRELHHLWDDAQAELGKVRFFGDLVVAGFFEGDDRKKREAKRAEFEDAVLHGRAAEFRLWLDELREAERPLVPFHWEIEFPEVFDRERPGFDVFVGNPPFQGGRNVTEHQGEVYLAWLLALHQGATGGADLVAHFFRRVFDLLRDGGVFGLIATNTIGQGDTRATGLRWICQHGGEILAARKRVKWPGLAAVVVSVVHVIKGRFDGTRVLDDHAVETISAFLFHRGEHDDPARLVANAGKSFQGSIVLGMGFTFDDTDTNGVATPIAEMRRLIARDPRNQEVIFPYIGGEELNTSPTHAHHRYVINFGERTEEECRQRWRDLMAIVEAKVKPERATKAKDVAESPWWKFWRSRTEFHEAIAGLARVLAVARVGQYGTFSFLPAGITYSEQLIVVAMSSHAAFCALQSRPHEIWARFFGSSMKDDLRYTPSDCFETFPFPENWQTHPALEFAGKTYYEFRAALMVKNDEGLTKTYNCFHDPDERNPDIQKLRDLHAAMDRAVLDAYGWTDFQPTCDFLLDYEIDESEWGDKKKPYRYRWPDPQRDDLLARLLDLNSRRAKEEALSGPTASKPSKKPRRKGRGAPPANSAGLFG